jgi:tRNA dimethylallyltransferase
MNASHKTYRVLCVMGPTASGKTDLILRLTEQFPIEVISVDSAMIYREMDIGTAKPNSEELKQCPHHLINILDPDQTYSAAQFVADAEQQIQAILLKGKIPVLVGGTMLYFHALQTGLSSLPPNGLGERLSRIKAGGSYFCSTYSTK